MAGRPIFVVTHPRACSTAFERVFMTRPDDLACFHEPFGDAFYYGPELLGERFAKDLELRESSGFINTTYKDVLDRLLDEDKRVFIKDMAYYLMAPRGQPTSIAPSLAGQANGVDKASGSAAAAGPANPTTIPLAALQRFRFAFLIRHPRRSIPSYYRCTIPPLAETTKFNAFMPSEAGYAELRRLFDYLRAQGLAGREDASGASGSRSGGITVIDADDLLDRPAECIQAFCEAVDLDFRPAMLEWNDPASQARAADAFAKWDGWHNDALASAGLKPRAARRKTPTTEEEDAEWKAKYGAEGQATIRKCVEDNTPDYEYLKQFALKF